MNDLKFESRERQEITSLLLNIPISSGCTQTGSHMILALVSQGAWWWEREADNSPLFSRDIKTMHVMHLNRL